MDEKSNPELIFHTIGSLRLTEALKCYEQFLGEHPYIARDEELQAINEDYRRMLDYKMQGYDDPQFREQLILLCQRLYQVVANARITWLCHEVAFYRETKQRAMRQYTSFEHIRQELERFVTESAMLTLEPEDGRRAKEDALYSQHHNFMRMLFDRIVVSQQWSHAERSFYESTLALSTIDTLDSQLIISAITLGCLTQFDIEKFLTLLHIYRHATDVQVQQRAFVGWALSLRLLDLNIYEDVKGQILKTCKAHAGELWELQRQIEICINTERDNETIQKEIMPDIIRNNGFRITGRGIEQMEEDPLEDILHPDAEDLRMEKLERDMKRMMDMQKQGTDIYFSGFSQTKRFTFFYTLCNWFVPFYIQHPDLGQAREAFEGNKFFQAVLYRSPFCNSDRYSMALALPKVVSQLPKEMQELMQQANAVNPELEIPDKDSPHFIRQFYLQDLYRFFRLHSQKKDFCYDPFSQNTPTAFDAYALLDHDLFIHFDNEKIMLWRARYHDSHHRYGVAMEELYFIEKQWPDSHQGLVMMARTMLGMHNGSEAADRYERLLQQDPGKFSYQLNHAIALSMNEEYEDAVEELFHLDYDYPGHAKVTRALAWTLMNMGRLEQAQGQYEKLLDNEGVIPEDRLNAAYCYWFNKQTARAVELFRFYLRENPTESLATCFLTDGELLKTHGITSLDQVVMENMIDLEE